MEKIAARKFKKLTDLDPGWAQHLTEPLEVTGYCNMGKSGITHLSRHLHFTGNKSGDIPSFSKCKYLTVAEGTFARRVSFAGSGIEKIGDLNITYPYNADRTSVDFSFCKKLKVAEGSFPGSVNFKFSGIERIGNITATGKIDVILCAKLNCLGGYFDERNNPGKILMDGETRKRAERLHKKEQKANKLMKDQATDD